VWHIIITQKVEEPLNGPQRHMAVFKWPAKKKKKSLVTTPVVCIINMASKE
jgi:hypothetical protein